MLQSDLNMTNSEKALQSWCFRLFWHSSTQNRLRCLSLPWFRVWCKWLMPKAPKMVIMALVLSLLALPAFGLRREGALTFSTFKCGMNAHGHGNTKLATINALRPRALFQRIQWDEPGRCWKNFILIPAIEFVGSPPSWTDWSSLADWRMLKYLSTALVNRVNLNLNIAETCKDTGFCNILRFVGTGTGRWSGSKSTCFSLQHHCTLNGVVLS